MHSRAQHAPVGTSTSRGAAAVLLRRGSSRAVRCTPGVSSAKRSIAAAAAAAAANAENANANANGAATSIPPRRAIVILPGLGNDAGDYAELADILRQAGAAHVSVASVARWNWALNALALKEGAWWRGELAPRPAVDWYLRRTQEAVEQAAAALAVGGGGGGSGGGGGGGGGRITLLAHSAGGWIGRVYLRDYRPAPGGGGGGQEAAASSGGGGAGGQGRAAAALIDRFVSLGSPHRAPPLGVEGVVDQTRGILTWVERNCPGATHHDEGVRYVTIGGRLVRGRALSSLSSLSDGDDDDKGGPGAAAAGAGAGPAPPLPALAAGLVAGVGYQQVCGRADSHGDFIVPTDAAHLGDPRGIEADVDGVFHSPLGSSLRWPLGGGPVLPPWYGHASVAPGWVRWAVGEEAELPAAGQRHRLGVVAPAQQQQEQK